MPIQHDESSYQEWVTQVDIPEVTQAINAVSGTASAFDDVHMTADECDTVLRHIHDVIAGTGDFAPNQRGNLADIGTVGGDAHEFAPPAGTDAAAAAPQDDDVVAEASVPWWAETWLGTAEVDARDVVWVRNDGGDEIDVTPAHPQVTVGEDATMHYTVVNAADVLVGILAQHDQEQDEMNAEAFDEVFG